MLERIHTFLPRSTDLATDILHRVSDWRYTAFEHWEYKPFIWISFKESSPIRASP